MSDEAPFAVGQRVRMSWCGRAHWPQRKSFTGVVKRVGRPYLEMGYDSWCVKVKRDGIKETGYWENAEHWQRTPVSEMTLDETCRQLVAEYHAGNTSAALGLAERIFEIMGGTKKENQA